MKMMIILVLSLLPAFAIAHGEDKPGPHGGHIRMPGAFHVEVNYDNDQSLHIFLLDMEFKNPTVKDSKIAAKVVDKNKTVNFDCKVMGGNHFHCIPASKYPVKGEIVIQATRENAVGNEARYKLPLKEFAEEKPAGHHHH